MAEVTSVNAVTINGKIETTFTEYEGIFQGVELATGTSTFILDQEIPILGSSFEQKAVHAVPKNLGKSWQILVVSKYAALF